MKYLLLVVLLTACAAGNRYYLKEDNDYFNPLKSTDNKYTQGLRLGVEVPDETGSHEYYGQHLFYTPVNKKVSIPDPTDRPYAGYLSAGYKASYREEDTLTTYGVDAGIVGPSALGEQVQNGFHSLIGDNSANGWDYQLKNEPVFTFLYDNKDHYYFSRYSKGILTYGAHLGNMFTHGFYGATYSLHYNMHDLFHPGDVIYPRLATEEMSGYFFVSGLAKIVARNLLLDGNTFRESASVDKRYLVGEVRTGLGLVYKGYDLTYTYVTTSPEFIGSSPFSFAEITLGVTW